MEHKRYTISQYYDTEPLVDAEIEYNTGEQVERIPLNGYDTLEDIVKWCEDNNVRVSFVLVTEWDTDNIDAYGVPEIVESNNLDYLIANDVV